MNFHNSHMPQKANEIRKEFHYLSRRSFVVAKSSSSSRNNMLILLSISICAPYNYYAVAATHKQLLAMQKKKNSK